MGISSLFFKKIYLLIFGCIGSPVLHGHSLAVVSRDYQLQYVGPSFLLWSTDPVA